MLVKLTLEPPYPPKRAPKKYSALFIECSLLVAKKRYKTGGCSKGYLVQYWGIPRNAPNAPQEDPEEPCSLFRQCSLLVAKTRYRTGELFKKSFSPLLGKL
eukprot:5910408-Amphidinium_carterae.1